MLTTFESSARNFKYKLKIFIKSIRLGGEWARCDQIGKLDNYTFLESWDHVDNRNIFFVLIFGQEVFSGNFLTVVTDVFDRLFAITPSFFVEFQDIDWILYRSLFKMLVTLAYRSNSNMLLGNVYFFNKRIKSLWENLILSIDVLSHVFYY